MPIIVAAMAFRQNKNSYDVYYSILAHSFSAYKTAERGNAVGLLREANAAEWHCAKLIRRYH